MLATICLVFRRSRARLLSRRGTRLRAGIPGDGRPARRPRRPGRLAGWLVFVLALAGFGYARTARRHGDAGRPRVPVLVLGRRARSSTGSCSASCCSSREGCRVVRSSRCGGPRSWPRALGLALARARRDLGHRAPPSLRSSTPDEEQGLVPDDWDSSRAGAFIAFFLVVTFVARRWRSSPTAGSASRCSRRTARGSRSSSPASSSALPTVSSSRLPVLTASASSSAGFAARTDSIYPSMLLHGVFNGTALLVSVSVRLTAVRPTPPRPRSSPSSSSPRPLRRAPRGSRRTPPRSPSRGTCGTRPGRGRRGSTR